MSSVLPDSSTVHQSDSSTIHRSRNHFQKFLRDIDHHVLFDAGDSYNKIIVVSFLDAFALKALQWPPGDFYLLSLFNGSGFYFHSDAGGNDPFNRFDLGVPNSS